MLIVAIAAVAVVLPAVASAGTIYVKKAPTLEILLPVGSPLTGTSLKTTIKTAFSTLTCKALSVENKLTQNKVAESGGFFEAQSLEPTSTKCETSSGSLLGVDEIKATSLRSSVAGSGTMELEFGIPLEGIWTCHYKAVALPFTYSVGSDELSFSGALTSSPVACGAASIAGGFSVSSKTWPFPLVLK
jgi:hypothetical protein